MAETTDDRLRLLIERVERLEEEKKGIADDIRDVYAGAKAFVSAFSKTLAKELVSHGIRVNCVSPGTIHTAFHDRFSDEAKREAARKTIPMQRLGLAEDCAGTFLYLASDRASGYVTGQVIEVNGGQLMP